MNEVENHKLQVEAQKGEAAQRAWEYHVEPFFIEKEKELFNVFREIGTTKQEDLMTLKLQVNVLAMLKDYFQTKINTGLLASKQLQIELDKEQKDG